MTANTAPPKRQNSDTRAPRPPARTPFEIDDRVTLKLDHELAYTIQGLLEKHGDQSDKTLVAFTRVLKTKLDNILADDQES